MPDPIEVRTADGRRLLLVHRSAVHQLDELAATRLMHAASHEPGGTSALHALAERCAPFADRDLDTLRRALAQLFAHGRIVLADLGSRLPLGLTAIGPTGARMDQGDWDDYVPLSQLSRPSSEHRDLSVRTWVAIHVGGEGGLSVVGTELRIRLPDGEQRVEHVGADGRLRFDDIGREGTCEVEIVGPAELNPGITGDEPISGISVPCVTGGRFALSTGREHRVVVLRPTATIVELDDAAFDTAGAVFRPCTTTSSATGPTGFHGLAAALNLVQGPAGTTLWVLGHADRVGSEGDNVLLSQQRAKNVHLFLAGERRAWAEHCQAHYTVGDFQAAYRWVAAFRGWDCDPGIVDEDFGPASRAARDHFREMYNLEYGGSLVRHVEQSTADWEAIFDLFDEGLAAAANVDTEQLAQLRAALSWLSLAFVGLGEAYPREAPDLDDFASSANRRVDVVGFPAGTVRYLGSPAHPERLYGSTRVFRRMKLFVPGASPEVGLDTFVARLVDEHERPLAGERYELCLPDGSVLTGALDGHGYVRRTGVPGGLCRLVFPDLDAREWNAQVLGPRPVTPPPDFVGVIEPDDNAEEDYEDFSSDSDEHDPEDTGDEYDDRPMDPVS